MTITEHEYEQANARMRRAQQSGTVARARYQRATRRVVIELTTGVQLSVPAERLEGLADATARQLDEIEISPSGLGLHWPQLDADLYVPALLQGILGGKKWMASLLGKKGGASRSDAKQAAARANGRLGGRPSGKPGANDTRKGRGPAAIKTATATGKGSTKARIPGTRTPRARAAG